ncbi:MAG TPA: hypothetical protein DCF63_01255 [Planctomycetaceae bacterium]|nr:hypothetical protein [Planctomycetaceae bacterium]
MALTGDSRMDRRRRVLLDASQNETANANSSRTHAADRTGSPTGKRDAGYSLNVRQACGLRLVQLIPVRRRSYWTIVFVSFLVTSVLLIGHYLVYVSGSLPWYGHPLATTLDAAHPQSLAAWFGSHLWLLCLGATILTFQIRRHKLDDYSGEYRLWFWLVITCLLASIDSTAHVTELLGQGLDPWSRLNLGWSGKAVVQATTTVLVGVLGLRLCTELKSVPLSLGFWLLGLVAWAGSAALSQDGLRITLTPQMRYWLQSALWLAGLTSIWLAALTYLRHVYIEAQRRFLLRSRMTRQKVDRNWSQKFQQSLAFFRRRPETDDDAQPKQRRKKQPAQDPDEDEADQSMANSSALAFRPAAAVTSKPGPLSLSNRKPVPSDDRSRPTQTSGVSPAATARPESQPALKRWSFKLWPGRDVPEEDAEEYRKVSGSQQRREAASQQKAEKQVARQTAALAKAEAKAAQKAEKEAARQNRRQEGSSSTGRTKRLLLLPWTATAATFSKIKLPSLSSFKLSPPDTEQSDDGPSSSSSASASIRPISSARPLPGTSRPEIDDEEDQESDRYMSKSERKKLRRQGRAA